MLDGRVKTLHPKVHGGLLARRDLPAHMAALREHGIAPIDLLVVNLYPFEATVAKPGCTLDDAIENIDIGGPAMVRSAAKNWKRRGGRDRRLAISPGPRRPEGSRRRRRADPVRAGGRRLQPHLELRRRDQRLPVVARARCGGVPATIQFPGQANGRFVKLQDLRYGENPHQRAAFYRDLHPAPGSLVTAVQLQGKELSYNNIADADAAWECVKSFAEPACVIVKHANPCGVAIGDSPLAAYRKAFKTDPTSAFGGIIAFNARSTSARRAHVEAVRRGADRAGLHARGARDLRRQGEHAGAADRAPAGGATAWERGRNAQDIKRVGSGLLMQTADNREIDARRAEDRDAAHPDSRADARPAVRLEGRQVRQEQRHRVLRRRHDHRRRRGPDEPRRLGAHRQHQGRERRPARAQARRSRATRSSRSATASTW